jgi:hypothetical protein
MPQVSKDPDKVQPFTPLRGNMEASLSVWDFCQNPPATSFDDPFSGINT